MLPVPRVRRGRSPTDCAPCAIERRSIGAAAEAAPRPAWLEQVPDPGATAAGDALGRDVVGADAGDAFRSSPQSATRTSGVVYTVFVTWALGAEALRTIFRSAAGADVRIVFRGVAPGERLMDAIREIHALLDGIDPLPNVEIDPTPFRDQGVDSAPAIMANGPDGVLARVAGLSDPDWLRRQIRAGARGDLGVRGPTVAVSEPDLIAELQRRLAALDLAALREAAIAAIGDAPRSRRCRPRRTPASAPSTPP